MNEPKTREEMVSRYKAARSRMLAAGVKPTIRPKKIWKWPEARHARAIYTLTDGGGRAGAVLRAVAEAYEASVISMRGTGKHDPLPDARAHAAYVLHKTGMSLDAIGRLLNRHHSTIHHSVNRVWPRLNRKHPDKIQAVAKALAGLNGGEK